MRLILELEETDDMQHLERVISLLKPYLSKIQYPDKMRKIKEFLALSGAWKDERDAEEIIADMR